MGDKDRGLLGIFNFPILQTAVDNLTSIYNSRKDRSQKEEHFRARQVFERGLLRDQLRGQREVEEFKLRGQTELEREKRRSEHYPLVEYGQLASLLPDDGFPAVLVSDVFAEVPSESVLSVRSKITSALAQIESSQRLFRECSGVLRLKASGSLSAITGTFQALEICVNEFYNRPAIVIYHEANRDLLSSYALLWNFFPLTNGIGWSRHKITDLDLHTASSSPSLDSRDATTTGRTIDNRASGLADLCVTAICAAIDAYRFDEGQQPALLLRYVQHFAERDLCLRLYAKFFDHIGSLANGDCEVYKLSPFYSWLEEELRLLYEAGYAVQAEEHPGGAVGLIISINSSARVGAWLSRDFSNIPPKIIWQCGMAVVPYEIPVSAWVSGFKHINMVDIVREIWSNELGARL